MRTHAYMCPPRGPHGQHVSSGTRKAANFYFLTTALIVLYRNCNAKPQTSAKETSMAVLSLRKTHLGNVQFPWLIDWRCREEERARELFSVSSFPKKIFFELEHNEPCHLPYSFFPSPPVCKTLPFISEKKERKPRKKPPQGLLECFSMFCCRSRLPFQRLQEQQHLQQQQQQKITLKFSRPRRGPLETKKKNE